MNGTTESHSPVAAAMRAVEKLRAEIKKHGGKPGGNKNEKLLGYVDTIESTLERIPPLQGTIDLINQQTQLAVHAFRNLQHLQLKEVNNGGDDGTSEVKGE